VSGGRRHGISTISKGVLAGFQSACARARAGATAGRLQDIVNQINRLLGR